MHETFSLNGTWEMAYSETVYSGEECPWKLDPDTSLARIMKNAFLIRNAVPGYWEDMTDAFAYAPFFGSLKINPEFGQQRYPIAGVAPDMALPNIMGNFFYRRTFCCDGIDEPAAIHFEGVQNAVSVWLNDVYLGRHEGYSTPFDMDIPEGILHDGENTVVLSVSNIGLTGYDGEPVSGLTNRAANQYTGGITGDVELRVYRSALRDAAIIISEDCSLVSVNVELSQSASFDWSVYDGETRILSGRADGDFCFCAKGLEQWSPENPKLYTLEICCGEAVLSRRFGVRRLTAEGVHLRLNEKPVYLRGICEHCYYPETVHPNHDISFYRNVIKTIKKLGFNFIRFHTHIPVEEYMQAADELGILIEVESPNNTSLEEWKQIVRFCRRHTSVVMYSCGNELQMDDPFIEHQRQCANAVHENTDSLFSPMSAMRGLEYCWIEEDQMAELVNEPFTHHPRRLKTVGEFSDVYNSYTLGLTSYCSLDADPEKLDDWSRVYNKPRLSHEICIQGCYTDLSLARRYEGKRVGKTDMFDSIRRHLDSKGLLPKAPLYFKNSSEWQRRLRKHNFEAVRLCKNLAGFDFLGPIDTHWHTFGYDVGMMNEFYELKPGETVRNVLMYNSPTVLLTDLGTDFNFIAGHQFKCSLYASHYGADTLQGAELNVRLTLGDKLIYRRSETLETVEAGEVTKLFDLDTVLPECSTPGAMQLYVTLECGDTYAENQWELYLFPMETDAKSGDLLISNGMSLDALCSALEAGKNVLLLGDAPFVSLPTTFQMALAGRTSGNLATVIYDHPALKDLSHDGFCGWQFRRLLEGGSAVYFEADSVPFDPIVEVVSTHKFAIRQSALFEFRALNGKLLVCTLNFSDSDPAARWLKNRLIAYAGSEAFDPVNCIDKAQLYALAECEVTETAGNTNFAFNANDKTAMRRKK